MRMNGAVFQLRRLIQRGYNFHNMDDMLQHGLALIRTPGLRGAPATLTKSESRQARMRPPRLRRGFELYRSDGAKRRRAAQQPSASSGCV